MFRIALAILSLFAAVIAAPLAAHARGPGGPWIYIESFPGGTYRPGLQLYGSAAVNTGGYLVLTPDLPGQNGLAVVGGGKISDCIVTFDYYFQHASPSGLTADGMSVNLGNIPDGIVPGPKWELGPGNGLTLCFDIFDFNNNNGYLTYGMRLIRDGVVVASAANALTVADRGQWRSVNMHLYDDGGVDVYYNGVNIFGHVLTGYVPDPRHRFSFAARTGSESAEQRIRNIFIAPVTILSADSCKDAAPVRGDGFHWISTLGMSTDGIAACGSFGNPANTGIAKDVWLCWTATATGAAKFSTIGSAGWDTKMALYDGCGVCPEGLGLLACNDHNSAQVVQAEIVQQVQAGHQYLLRVGGSPGSANGESGPAFVQITTKPDCPADFDKNGVRSIDDVFIYLNAWFAGCP